MNDAIQVKVVFSPVFRALFHCHERDMIIDARRPTVNDLLRQLSRESAGKIDALIFEKDTTLISAGLMIQVNDRVYTGTQLYQTPVPLTDKTVVTLMYYVSGG